ncbi:transcriptional regulator, TetR family [Nocardia amikacinitolerans]|uniref:Transcriptional regulator, TetR family n=1 Tax=Nocardia amikacinitolerans TaxID=756689 RepID=A0A285KZC2_9NOCA|nr:TetR/AcrR family transcriptional regulator [Nocardia amikacinitolerans]MCP2296955.1 transcriptional regulator, TetR family [Nocardia amikacinitolerans]SNY77985.1 transcriptional regulator, TetR family [Nocardia amikacinitolerans]
MGKRAAEPGKSGAILDIFTRHVAEKGYDGTSFSDVASELGISQGLIVHHYGTKARLLDALHVSYMRRRIEEAEHIVAAFSTPTERLAALLHASMLYQVHDRNRTVAFQREVARFAQQDENSEGRKLRRHYIGILHGLLDAGIAAGEFRPVEISIRSLLIFGAAQWAWTWFEPEGRSSAEQVGAEMVDLTLGSLLVDRTSLPRLSDPDGPLVAAVIEIISAAEGTPNELPDA